MCGIAGAFAPDPLRAVSAVEGMCTQMRPRGPDDGGIESFPWAGNTLAMGARRLAIIDPSPAGHQPMVDPDRGHAVVFNGMIYNFRELRERLRRRGETFQSDCDTEVLLRAYGHYGRDCVRHLSGMFAFAIFDSNRREVFMARDRLGIKPLYWYADRGRFAFGSQVRALLASGLVKRELSPAGVMSFLEFGAVAEPQTAFAGVTALPAGCTGVFDGAKVEIEGYWEPPPSTDPDWGRNEDAPRLRAVLDAAVESQLVSDAPLGVFLSGGVDSSVIAAAATRHVGQVRTLSVVFDEPGYSEERFSRSVAAAIDSDHREVRMSGHDLLNLLPDAFRAMDQPTSDGINTFAVSHAAQISGLKVALSGLGADELFNGYGHAHRVRAMEAARRLPLPITKALAPVAGRLAGAGRETKLQEWLGGQMPRGSSYELLRRLFLPGEASALSRGEGPTDRALLPQLEGRRDLVRQVALLDLTNYMRNTLLRDTDAMSMARGLEVRVPFLDDAVVDWTLRLATHRQPRRPKGLLLDATRQLLPREVWDRPKQGFVLPIAEWMSGALRTEVSRLLEHPPDIVGSLIDPDAMRGIWRGYLGGDARWQRPWALYALCRWAEDVDVHAGTPTPADVSRPQ